MKHILEKFIRMKTTDVLDAFASLPRAEVYKDFVFIPGTRDPRLLLVGHADTVFNKPPKGVLWRGGWATVGEEYKFFSSHAYTGKKHVDVVPATTNLDVAAQAAAATTTETAVVEKVQGPTTKAQKKAAKKAKDEKEAKDKADAALSLKDSAQEFGLDKQTGIPFVTIIGKSGKTERLTFPEYRARHAADRDKELAKEPPATGYSQYGRGGNSQWENSNWSQPVGLGADDRCGIAILWLLRNSGHSIIVTDGEERGCVGARAAAKTPAIVEQLANHQFAIEIDRMYDSTMVFYDVATPEFKKYMTEISGFQTEIGSTTDIREICPAAGICGVNLAAGYWGQHSVQEFIQYEAWLRTLNLVKKMCYTQADQHPKFELKRENPTPPSTATTRSTNRSSEGSETKALPRRGPVHVQGFVSTPAVGTEGERREKKEEYKDGRRFLGGTEENKVEAEATTKGVAVVTTKIDPNTGKKTITKQVISEVEVPVEGTASLFPAGSAPLETAMDDLARQTVHRNPTLIDIIRTRTGLLSAHEANAPIH